MFIYNLYVKTHNLTGLKYLGHTIQNPFKYTGSGTRWLNHIRKHGNDVKTIVLLSTLNEQEMIWWGSYFSDLWNVVESVRWANLCPETGNRPPRLTGDKNPFYGKKHSAETIFKLRNSYWKQNSAKQKYIKQRFIIHPDENIEPITNLFQFCKIHNLNQGI